MTINPFIKDAPVKRLGKISKKDLFNGYKSNYHIQIEDYFPSADEVELYECETSGYRFFYPFNISGDSKFYEQLQHFDWYYMPWKWEHELCRKFIQENDRILEVGCGQGAFLNRISQLYSSVDCVGLELNKSAATKKEKYEIINAFIDDFSQEHEGEFDVVCSFQVLEHISTVNEFLEAKIRCIKKNGLLVISVPNNDSFIQYNKNDLLNMPPHHVGLWTEKSVRKIGELFNMELIEVDYEPLPEYHYYYYTFTMLQRWIGEIPARVILKGFKMTGLSCIYNSYLKKRTHQIKGHTILVAFRKKD